MIQIEHLTKTYRGLKVLQDISISISSGDFISILGASGSGKSTFLRLVAGLEKPSQGEINFSQTPQLSYVFQDPCLLPWLTVEENISLPFVLLKERPVRVLDMLELVGLKDFRSYYPGQLSGGMKMRVSLARALVTNPEIVLLDEPFSALDEMTRFQLQDEVRKIWHDRKMTILFVTHSIAEAVYLANRVLLLDKRKKSFVRDVKLELPAARTQTLKYQANYMNYVTDLSRILRGQST
jgi:NitT/TauT family transport system ATP-binding protein